MMKSRRAPFTGFRSAQNSQLGFTLIEAVIALGILAAVAVIFLVGMQTSSRAVMVSQEHVSADSLAKSEMEYVKSLPYDDTSVPLIYAVDPTITIPQGYNISVTAVRLDRGYPTVDDGIQQITVTVTRDGVAVLTVSGYKVNR
jgi:type II secretory pathway pseudopilin PulG